MPGLKLKLKNYYTHHDYSLAEWDLLNAEGKILTSGSSFAEYNKEGKIVEMSGFFKETIWFFNPK